MVKAFILANGEAKRWENYKNVPKHLITINGETIISRMVRLLEENNVDDITILGSYKIEGCKNYMNKTITKYDVFLEISEISKAPFVILNGDCYYTDAIIKDCVERPIEKWGHWENPYWNEYTGKPYGEGYIHKVTDINWWERRLNELKDDIENGVVDMSKGNDWIINEYLYDRDCLYTGTHTPCEPYDILWQDQTDDFDFPKDLDRFLRYTGYHG